MNPTIPYAIICFAAVLSWAVIGDWVKWKKGQNIDHSKTQLKTALRGALLLPTVIMLAVAIDWKITWGIAYAWALTGFSFWTLFDGLYNLARKQKWNFPGSEDGKEDAFSDNMHQRWPWLWLFNIIITSVLIIIYTQII